VTKQPKYVFVTGGVASGLGKGITTASLGRLFKSRGLRVTLQKLDPYINVDPGTMNPFEHGESRRGASTPRSSPRSAAASSSARPSRSSRTSRTRSSTASGRWPSRRTPRS